MAHRAGLPVTDNSMDNFDFVDELVSNLDDVSVINDKQKEKFSLRLLFQNEQPPSSIKCKRVKAVVDCLKRMRFLDFHDCHLLASRDDDYYGFCIFTTKPFKTKEIEIESGDIFLANTDANGEKIVVSKNNTAHGQIFRKIFEDEGLRKKHIFMGFAQHSKWLIGRSGTFNSELYTNLLPFADDDKKKEGLFIFRTFIYGSIIMFKLSKHTTMTPYASAMGICLFLIISKVGTAEQKQQLPIKDIFVDHSDVFMTQMFLGLNIHPTILAVLYRNINREKVINETLNLLFDELCAGAKDFTADQYENMLNKLKEWVGDEDDVTSKQLSKLMDSNENKYETRKAASRYQYNGDEINLNEWLEKIQSGWIYNGKTVERERNDGTCDQCGQNNLRYEFFITNEYTNSEIKIGSECVTKYNFTVMDDQQNSLSTRDAKKKVNRDKAKSKEEGSRNRVCITLVALERQRIQQDPDFTINFQDFLKYACANKGFTPQQINILAWKLKQYKIEHNPADFKMLLTKGKHQKKFEDIKKVDWHLKRILPYMTSAQKKQNKVG